MTEVINGSLVRLVMSTHHHTFEYSSSTMGQHLCYVTVRNGSDTKLKQQHYLGKPIRPDFAQLASNLRAVKPPFAKSIAKHCKLLFTLTASSKTDKSQYYNLT